jgi:hypothetical protein
MNSLLMKKASRVVAWTMTAATSLWLVVPSQAAFGATYYRFKFVDQTPTTLSADGKAHIVTANAGDTVAMSVTLTNLSSETIKPKSALGAVIPGKQVPVGSYGIGTRGDAMTPWLDASSFVLNGNRLAYYDGATDVAPGANFTMSWNVKIASTAANGTYDYYFRPVFEWKGWTRQVAWNGTLLATEKADIFTRFIIGGGGTTSTGNVTVSAGTMPSAASVAQGTSNVRVATWNFQAGSQAATITGLTVKRLGAGEVNDILNAYIYQGNNRLTSGRTFNTSTNQATFSGLGVNLAANTSTSLSLVIDFDAANDDAGAQHQFSLTANTAISAGGTVGGTFPITGNIFTLAGATAGIIDIEKAGSTSDVTTGTTGAKLSEFRLSATTEDAWLQRIALYQGGTAVNATITNLQLKQGGTVVASATGIDTKGYAVFTLTAPFKIEAGNNRLFEVYGDVTSRVGDDIKFYADATVDIYATGGTFGGGMRSTIDSTFDAASDVHDVNILGGILTISFIGPAAQDISNQANDQMIFRANITASSEVEVRNWRVRLDDTTAGGDDLTDDVDNDNTLNAGENVNVQDIKLWNLTNNTVIAGPTELATTVGLSTVQRDLTFTEDLTLSAGTSFELGISVDIKNSPATGLTLKATLGDGTNTFTLNDLRNVGSNSFLVVTDVAPSGQVAGKVQTVAVGGLGITVAPNPTDSNVVVGATNYEATAFNFTAGSASDIKVNSIRMTFGLSDANDNAYDDAIVVANAISSVRLMDGATQVGIVKSPQAVSVVDTDHGLAQITFDNLNWIIQAAATKKLSVQMSFNSAYTPAGGNADYVRVDIESSDVSAIEVLSGNSLSTIPAADVNAAGAADVVVTLNSVGSLTVTADADTPMSDVVIAGATGVTLAKFRFTAQNEAFLVKKLGVVSTVAGNGRISTFKLSYPAQDGTTKVVTAGLSGTANQIDISGTPMYVPANSSATLTFLGDLATFNLLNDTESAVPISLDLDADNTSSYNQATGLASGTDDLSWAAGNITSNDQWVFRTRVTVQAGSNTSALTNSEQDLYQFTMRSDAAGNVAVKQITVNAAITEVIAGGTLTIGSLKLYKGTTDISSNVTFNVNGSVSDTTLDETETRIVIEFNTYETVGNTTQTYTLKGTPAGFVAADDDYATFSIANDSTYDLASDGTIDSVLDSTNNADGRLTLANRGTTDTNDTQANFIWADYSDIGIDGTTDNDTGWFSGFLLKDLPTATVTRTI